MKKLNKKIFIILMGLVLMLAGAYAAVRFTQPKAVVKKVKKLEKEQLDPIVVDTVKLNLFKAVYARLNPGQHTVSMQGDLTIDDGADSLANLNHLAYHYAKKGKEMYYQLGAIETVNAKGLYVYIDHDQKKIMVSKQKEYVAQLPMPNLDQLIAGLKQERYQVVETNISDVTAQVAMVNPTHITCTEYALEFDKKTFKPSLIFARLTNLTDPLNRKMDKTMALKINLMGNEVNEKWLNPYRFVNHIGKGYEATTGFKGYEVIEVF